MGFPLLFAGFLFDDMAVALLRILDSQWARHCQGCSGIRIDTTRDADTRLSRVGSKRQRKPPVPRTELVMK
jgi:hypothetical protein